MTPCPTSRSRRRALARREHTRDERARPVHRTRSCRERRRRRSRSPSSAPVRTAGFIAHQLWVTPYAPDELYAAGSSRISVGTAKGCPAWTPPTAPTDVDVVLWYTLGITHIPRPEDWPYMPAHRGGSVCFRLVLRTQSGARRSADGSMTSSGQQASKKVFYRRDAENAEIASSSFCLFVVLCDPLRLSGDAWVFPAPSESRWLQRSHMPPWASRSEPHFAAPGRRCVSGSPARRAPRCLISMRSDFASEFRTATRSVTAA